MRVTIGWRKTRDSKVLTFEAEPWGGTPEHPSFFSVYSVGATSGMLRGTKWRGEGIRAFQYMMQNAQQGPLCYWECATMPTESPWSGTHPHSGTGDCPHLFGPALAEKVLIESLIAENANGTVIIGRGIPAEWCAPGQRIEISDAPVSSRRKIGYRMEAFADRIEIELTGAPPLPGRSGSTCRRSSAERSSHLLAVSMPTSTEWSCPPKRGVRPFFLVRGFPDNEVFTKIPQGGGVIKTTAPTLLTSELLLRLAQSALAATLIWANTSIGRGWITADSPEAGRFGVSPRSFHVPNMAVAR